jgi:regulator of replication initiation timing
MLPNLASARRLTKVLIVNASVEHVRQQRALCLAAAQDMQNFVAENNRLVAEVNAWRTQFGEPGAPLTQVNLMTEAMMQLAEVKNHVFGTFNAGFGDNWVENASQSQPNTSIELHDTMQSVDNPYLALGQQTDVNLPPQHMQTNVETLAPNPLSSSPPLDHDINPERHLGPLLHSSMTHLDMFDPLTTQLLQEEDEQTSGRWVNWLDIDVNQRR